MLEKHKHTINENLKRYLFERNAQGKRHPVKFIMQRYAFCFKRIYIFSFFYTTAPPQTQFSDPKGTIHSKNRGFFLTTIACIIIPLACGTPPCKQRGELLIAVIEQLFLLLLFQLSPFPRGTRQLCCRAGDVLRFILLAAKRTDKNDNKKNKRQHTKRETKFNNCVTSFPLLGGP